MKEIDLIPAWYVLTRRRSRDRVIRCVYLAGVAVAMGVLAYVRHGQTAAAADALNAMRGGDYAANETEGMLSGLHARWKEVDRRRGLLSEARGASPPHVLLAEIAGLMPEATVLTSMHCTETAGAHTDPEPAAPPASGTPAAPVQSEGRIAISGLAADDGQVGRFMASLSDSDFFTDVKLSYSRPIEIENREARAFELACRLTTREPSR